MDNGAKTRGLMLVTALLASAFFVGCQEMGPTGVDVDPQFAKGGKGKGNGGGPGAGNPPVFFALAGGISTPETQEGRVGADTRNLLEINHPAHASDQCTDPTASGEPCFRSAFNLGIDENMCEVPSGMPEADVTQLVGQINNGITQARWFLDIEIRKKRGGSAWISTHWYELDDPSKYVAILSVDGATEADGVWTIGGGGNGSVSLYGTGYSALECPWAGGITLTIDP